MKPEDVVGLVFGLVFVVVVLAVYIGLIVLGVKIAKRKNRSPHWMWFAVHPVGLIITLIVMACLSPLKRCQNCGQTSQAQARLCGFCGYDFATPPAYMPPQQGVYVAPRY
jgi:heme/copper-type cytochrome/quinol oxidase subunit 3